MEVAVIEADIVDTVEDVVSAGIFAGREDEVVGFASGGDPPPTLLTVMLLEIVAVGAIELGFGAIDVFCVVK